MTINTASNPANSPVGPPNHILGVQDPSTTLPLHICPAPLEGTASSFTLRSIRHCKEPEIQQDHNLGLDSKCDMSGRGGQVTESRVAGVEKEAEKDSWTKQCLSSPQKPGRN